MAILRNDFKSNRQSNFQFLQPSLVWFYRGELQGAQHAFRTILQQEVNEIWSWSASFFLDLFVLLLDIIDYFVYCSHDFLYIE